MVVSKFGGTSMGDAACMLRSAKVALDRRASLVVVSATSGTTNDLLALAKFAEQGRESELNGLLDKVEHRHLQIARELDLADLTQIIDLCSELRSLAKGIYYLRDCSLKASDAVVSIGERLSSVLFTKAMSRVLHDAQSNKKSQWLDVRDLLVTDEDYGKAKPQTDLIRKKCLETLADIHLGQKVYVTQGFIGRSVTGFTTTLGRGGSDYSAAILAEGIEAESLEIWTDVPGIATTDPRLVKEAKSIGEISFKEASELATFGAKVLHPATLLPAMRMNIPVYVASSFAPEGGGTWVRREVKDAPLVRALALRRRQVLVTISTPEMLNTHGFLYRIFGVFNSHKVSIDSITTSEISVAVTLEESALQNKELIKELELFAEVSIEKNLSLVSLIGNNINHTAGLSKMIFEALPDINVRMICLGASKHNFCFLVDDSNAEEALKRLHQKFL
jgi:aspartate kinase